MLTVAEAVTHYLEERVHRSGKVIDQGRRDIAGRWLIEHFGDMPVDKIADRDVRRYIDRRERGEIGHRSSAGTHRFELAALVSALQFAVRVRRLDRGAVPHIDMPVAPTPQDRVLTRDELGALLNACPKERDGRLTRLYRFVRIASTTGARRRSIEMLTWSKVANGRIDFLPEGMRQSVKRRPIVPIPDALLDDFARAWHERTGPHVLDHSSSVYSAFVCACKRCDLDDVTPHTLRHTWATWAARAGVSMWDIAGVLGDTVATAQKRYAHHAPEYLKAAVNFMERSDDG